MQSEISVSPGGDPTTWRLPLYLRGRVTRGAVKVENARRGRRAYVSSSPLLAPVNTTRLRIYIVLTTKLGLNHIHSRVRDSSVYGNVVVVPMPEKSELWRHHNLAPYPRSGGLTQCGRRLHPRARVGAERSFGRPPSRVATLRNPSAPPFPRPVRRVHHGSGGPPHRPVTGK